MKIPAGGGNRALGARKATAADGLEGTGQPPSISSLREKKKTQTKRAIPHEFWPLLNYRLRVEPHLPILRALFDKKAGFMRRPNANKTKKSVAKRFKITATGKALRRSAGRRHLLETKSSKRRRRLRGAASVDATDLARVTESLPFNHRG